MGEQSSVVLNARNRVDRVLCFHVEREPVVLPVPPPCAFVYDGKAFAAWLRDRDRPHRRPAFASGEAMGYQCVRSVVAAVTCFANANREP